MQWKAGHSMMRRAPSTHPPKGLLTPTVLINRHKAWWRDDRIRASRVIEHPGRNLKPASRIGAAQRAAEDNTIRLVDHLMDENRQTEPWMPPIQKLAKAGPVGVIKLRCTIPSARTHRWATNHRRQRSCNGRLRYADQLRRPHQPWRQNQSCTNIQPGPPDGGRPVYIHP